ncbi:family 2 glycosyl transferase [Thermincola ferriacetica]|uniref:Family 2 glycosyl transferase n=1 Tax=Thermincola ferriacetica TaxID=281456 RepID=A0A0L6W3Y5_9FIRM|nr:glycosyltransferase [Thermincola ferriacetica]KNZ70078.1 family 2 glycosyl transferase [Thermincola ferriacetica]
MWTVLAACMTSLVIIAVLVMGMTKRFHNSSQPRHGFGPKFSLVLFLQNNEENLEWLVRRLMMLRYGNYEDFEILLFDMGSEDRTPQIAALLARDYPTIKLLVSTRKMMGLYEEIWRAASGRVVLLEEVGDIHRCNQIMGRIKHYLKRKRVRSWDKSPKKIETTVEYKKTRQNDTI